MIKFVLSFSRFGSPAFSRFNRASSLIPSGSVSAAERSRWVNDENASLRSIHFMLKKRSCRAAWCTLLHKRSSNRIHSSSAVASGIHPAISSYTIRASPSNAFGSVRLFVASVIGKSITSLLQVHLAVRTSGRERVCNGNPAVLSGTRETPCAADRTRHHLLTSPFLDSSAEHSHNARHSLGPS